MIRIDIGKIIKKRRKSLGLTHAEVAKSASIGQSTLSQIENGTSPTLDTYIKICDALGIEPAELLKDPISKISLEVSKISTEPIPMDLIELLETALKLDPYERKKWKELMQLTLNRNQSNL